MDLEQGKFTSGKHRGRTAAWVWENDRQYLLWLRDNGYCGPALQSELARFSLTSGTSRTAQHPVKLITTTTQRGTEVPVALVGTLAEDRTTQRPSGGPRVGGWSAPRGDLEEDWTAERARLLGRILEIAEERDELKEAAAKHEALERAAREARLKAADLATQLSDARRQVRELEARVETQSAPSPRAADTSLAAATKAELRDSMLSTATIDNLSAWCDTAAAVPRHAMRDCRAAAEKLVDDMLTELDWWKKWEERPKFASKVTALREGGHIDSVTSDCLMAIWHVGSKAAHSVTDVGWSRLDSFAMILALTRVLQVCGGTHRR